jgi:hypothetical protein
VGEPLDWDKSRDWIVLRSRHYQLALVVVFASAHPSIDELRLARKLRPEFSNESPAAFRRRIQHGRLDLGVLPREEGRAVASLATSLGLTLEHVATARIVHVFKDRSGPGYLLVEDDRDAEQLAAAMIAAGVPVKDGEVD